VIVLTRTRDAKGLHAFQSMTVKMDALRGLCNLLGGRDPMQFACWVCMHVRLEIFTVRYRGQCHLRCFLHLHAGMHGGLGSAPSACNEVVAPQMSLQLEDAFMHGKGERSI
jgi:hypothetical protein